MSVDLNKLAEKLKDQRNVRVTRDGRLVDSDKDNSQINSQNTTQLTPKRFFM